MSNWYVVQVTGGSEPKAREYVTHYVDRETYRTVFFPQRHIRRHVRGAWQDCIETLFPGYLFVVTNDPKAFAQELRKVPLFTRLLGSDLRFSCLDDREVAMLQAFALGPADTAGGNGRHAGRAGRADSADEKAQARGGGVHRDAMTEYILEMSRGIKEGNEVIILNGPLMDKTALIRKIDRHKRLAYVELEFLGRKKIVKMGLELVAKHGSQ